MKKTYVKPELVVESFQLDAAVAASCSSRGKQSIGYSQNTCTLEEEIPGLGYFGDKCAQGIVVDGDGNDTFCYHGPVATDAFMNS